LIHFSDSESKYKPLASCSEDEIESVTKRTKKKLRNKNKWIRNIRKKIRCEGLDYVNVAGNLVPAWLTATADISVI
jgi:hypothetical protein